MTDNHEQAGVRISRDLPCARCGYLLRGLPTSGACPECGESIATSLKGNLLRFADPHWLRTISRGAAWLHWGIRIFLIAFLLYLITLGVNGIAHAYLGEDAPLTRASETIWHIMSTVWVLTPAIIGIGVWMFTAPEPRSDGEIESHMTRLLAALIVPAFGLWYFVVIARAGFMLSAVAELPLVQCLFLIAIAHVWTLRRHLADLNRRIEKPRKTLTRPTAWRTLIIPLLFMLLFWIGPIRWQGGTQIGWVMPTSHSHHMLFIVTVLYWLWYASTAQQFGRLVRKEYAASQQGTEARADTASD